MGCWRGSSHRVVSSFSFWGCPASALAVADKGGRVLRAHPFFGTVAWCLFKSLLFPFYATRCRLDVPGVLASGSGLAASACSYACGRYLRIALGPGAGFPFVSPPGGRVVWWVSAWWSFPLPWADVFIHAVSVEISRFGAVSTGELAFLPPLICRFTVGSSGTFPRGNFWGFPWGFGLPVLSMVEFCLTLFLSFPGCSHPGLWSGFPPSPGCDCTGLVAWSLLAPRSWKPPCQSTPFARSVVLWRWCGRTTVSPLFPHLVRSTLAYDLSVSPLPHYRWSRVHGQASAGLICWVLALGGSVCGYTAPVGWLRGVFPCFAYCPTSSVLKRSSFGFSASGFALSLRDGVTLSGRVCLSPRSGRRLFLHHPGVWLESSRWGHPVGSGLSQISIGTKTFCAPSLVVGV